VAVRLEVRSEGGEICTGQQRASRSRPIRKIVYREHAEHISDASNEPESLDAANHGRWAMKGEEERQDKGKSETTD
jgi:hypothetical protein